METKILEILETAAITIGGFLIKKYVFLEPDMETKKQRIFYLVSFLLIGIVFLAFGKDIASLAALFMIELNICLSRDKHRLRSLLLLIPFLGIVNGLLLPLLFVPPYLLSLSAQEAFVFQLAVYGLLFVLLVIFYVKGRNWRSWFYENIQHRKLRKSEKYLLWMVGILMLFFSNVVAKQILEPDGNTGAADKLYGQEFALFVGISSISAFIMSVTIIVLIMQGNKRSFYHEQVSNMQSGLITFMAEVVENRDDNTGGHIKRTAEYVECITKELRRQGTYSDILTDRYVSDMVVAAPLHDIGKIHIPDAVLNKPGKLTEEEFEVMKTHTTAGEELLTHAKAELGESEYLNTAVEMAAYHHEWWNGKGYPYGISGEEIPLCARIMAVADVFDALTSKRCYKNAMPLEKAYAIIREESGTHFDPAVVEAFFAAVERNNAEKHKICIFYQIKENYMAAYLFAHFIGDENNGEQIYFSVSQDGLHWKDLNNGNPILISRIGTCGARDPFLVRSPETGIIYLIATDLRIEAGLGWKNAQENGSKNIIVWETENLTHWTRERACEVGIPDAGCVWAPEAVYDKEKEAFLVFFASKVKREGEAEGKHRIYAAYTKDFKTFSETFLYMEREKDVIDTTILECEGSYYRISKDEVDKRLILEMSNSLTGEFVRIDSPVLSDLQGVEGPEGYLLPDGKTWCLIADQFMAGKGYLPMVTENLSSGDFRILSPDEYDMGQTKKRHGGILQITDEEYERLRK